MCVHKSCNSCITFCKVVYCLEFNHRWSNHESSLKKPVSLITKENAEHKTFLFSALVRRYLKLEHRDGMQQDEVTIQQCDVCVKEHIFMNYR